MKVAGIVLYNPNIERLQENLDAVTCQVDLVVLVDNFSSNIAEVQQFIEKYNNCEMICNSKNCGIATALNQIGKKALGVGAEWFLTLDQDSVCQPKLINEYEKVKEDNVAIITCSIRDRNFDNQAIQYYKHLQVSADNYDYIDFCITSGSYVNTAIWNELGGFDELFFIDKVDTDFCFRIVQSGKKIIRIKYYGLLHEVGYGTKVIKFGKNRKFVVFNHSAFRCYYIIRNQIYFARKHEKELGKKAKLRYERTAWTRIFVYLFFEKDKLNKLKAWCRGILDGYKIPIS